MIPLRATRAEINLEAFAHNLRQVKGRLPGEVGLLAVVKADAYGHGACELARVAVEEGVKMLGVATLEEGIELRQEGIVAPILILSGITREQAEGAVAHDLSVVLYSLKVAEALDRAAWNRGSQARVHVKVDTGMGRLGLFPEEMGRFFEGLKGLKHLAVEGVMTHFAACSGAEQGEVRAEAPPHAATSGPIQGEPKRKEGLKESIERFREALLQLPAYGIGTPLVHAASSAAILDFPEAAFDMVRPGILLYGCTPSPLTREEKERGSKGAGEQGSGGAGEQGSRRSGGQESSAVGENPCPSLYPNAPPPLRSSAPLPLPLEPVLTLKTRIHCIKRFPPGSSIGYGQTYFTTRESRIAVLPLGYADGYSRSLSNRASVLVKGKRAPVVGRISMDLCTIDVTEIPGLEEGEEVVLLGRQGEEEITAWELASLQGTIPYEVFTAIGKRVPRVYLRGGAYYKARYLGSS
ncbi:MAG: alanine racemase [Nitrospinae bacterium]|nr:alanine racemase [Nitrospinota bacterium]